MDRRPLPTLWRAATPLAILLLLGSSCSRQESEQTPKGLPSASVTPVFIDVTLTSGIDFQHINGSTGRFYYPETYGSGVVFVDYDNDGDQDLYLINSAALPGFIESFEPTNALFENNGDGTFSDITEHAGVGDLGYGLGVCAADYDNDGRVDIYITVNGQQVEDGNGNIVFDANQGKGVLFHNETETENSWLKVRLEGTESNRDGFGTTVTIHTNDKMQKQALSSGQGYFSSNARELYFGLKEAETIDQIDVEWLSGTKQSFKDIPARQTIYILEGESLHQNTLILNNK